MGGGKRLIGIAVLLLAMSLWAIKAYAQTGPTATASSSALQKKASKPNSEDGEFTAFDLYVGGVDYGVVYGNYADNWFQPAHAADAVALLPAVKNPQDFIPMFQGRINKIRYIRGVGTLKVDTINFKLSLTVAKAESVLKTVPGLAAEKGTEKNFSIRNSLFVAGSTDTQSLNFTRNLSATHDTVFSLGNEALQSSGTFAHNGYTLTNALVRKDFSEGKNDLTFFSGLLQTNSNIRFAKSMYYTGARVATNSALLFQDTQLQASSLQVFLPQRAQVEVYKGSESSGQILYSRVLNFGTVQIDTRSFPPGSYNVEIVVRVNGAVISRETRPFIKTQDLPPRGKPEMSLEAGTLRNGLSMNGGGIVEASYAARLTENLGGRVGVAATSSDQVYEGSVMAQKVLPLFKMMGLLEVSLTGAINKTMSPDGIAASVQWTSKKAAWSITGMKTFTGTAVDSTSTTPVSPPDSLSLAKQTLAALNFSMPVNFGRYPIYTGFHAEYDSPALSGSRYRFGPTFSYVFHKIGNYTPTLKLEYSKAAHDQSVLLTYTLSNTDPVWNNSAQMTVNSDTLGNSTTAEASMNYNGKSSVYNDWRKRIAGSLGLNFDPLTSSTGPTVSNLSGTLDYTADAVQLDSYLNQNVTGAHTGQVGGELSSTLLWGPHTGFKATSQEVPPTEALVAVTLKGPPDQLLDITVNGATRATGYTGSTVVLPIEAYQSINLGVKSAASHTYLVTREKIQTIFGYPGNVAYRTFHVAKSVAVIGTLDDAAGKPLAQERFLYKGSAYYTDNTGFFTLDSTALPGEKLIFKGADFSCTARMPKDAETSDLADLGNISCDSKSTAQNSAK